jgi:hypothetical protein
LTAVANGSYQWLDCNNGNQPIPNATGQTFVPQNPGAYAVQITENGCTQSSACIDVLLTSVNEESIGNFYAFPNPTNNIITLSSPQFIKQTTRTKPTFRVLPQGFIILPWNLTMLKWVI